MKKLLSREPTPEIWSAIHGAICGEYNEEGFYNEIYNAAPALPEPGEVERWLRECAVSIPAQVPEDVATDIAKGCVRAADLIATLRSDRDAKTTRMWELGKKCDELEADNERLQKDAERYRWVRKNCDWAAGGILPREVKWVFWLNMKEPDISGPLTDETVPVQLDAAIDATKGKPC